MKIPFQIMSPLHNYIRELLFFNYKKIHLIYFHNYIITQIYIKIKTDNKKTGLNLLFIIYFTNFACITNLPSSTE